MSINASSRHHYNPSPNGEDDLFYKIDGSHYRLYDPAKAPTAVDRNTNNNIRIIKSPAGLTNNLKSFYEQFSQDVQNFENFKMGESEKLKNQVDYLAEENSQLRIQLKEFEGSVFGGVTDPVLKSRLSKLETAPLDTVIRECGVVLENRIRSLSQVDPSAYGLGLVELVFSPDKGKLKISDHRGEREGVFMLYRGAMQFIRNPPMHNIIEYPKTRAQLFIKLIDSLLILLNELQPPSPDKKAWTKERFFRELAVVNNQKVCEMIENVYNWSEENADRVWFGAGKKRGSFSFHFSHIDTTFSIFSIYTDGMIIFNYGWLAPKISDQIMTDFHNRLSKINQSRKIPSDFTKWPSRSFIDMFHSQENVEDFKKIIEWLGKEIKVAI
jgi:hypothetical protein